MGHRILKLASAAAIGALISAAVVFVAVRSNTENYERGRAELACGFFIGGVSDPTNSPGEVRRAVSTVYALAEASRNPKLVDPARALAERVALDGVNAPGVDAEMAAIGRACEPIAG